MASTPLDPTSLSVECKSLFCPDLKDVAKALERELLANFAEASARVTECPDLTQSPFGLAAKGLSGNQRLLDIGGVPYLVPLAQKEKLYDMKHFPTLTGSRAGQEDFIIGAGAAPCTFLNRNAEMMPNLLLRPDGSHLQKTHIARTFDPPSEPAGARATYSLMPLPPDETKMSLLANLFLSEGQTGPVLEVRCKGRKGQDNLVGCMRKALQTAFPDQAVGLGGTFLLKAGKAKIHVMPDFSPCPLNTDEDVEKWLEFYEMAAPLVCLSVMISQDVGLDLRVEHTHCFSNHGDGGHYHYDTTPETVEYVGYFNLAEKCYRVDRPKVTHNVGRD